MAPAGGAAVGRCRGQRDQRAGFPRGEAQSPRRRERAGEDSEGSSETAEVMTTHKITLIPGDGTGPEIVEATRRATEATGVQFERNRQELGVAATGEYCNPLQT